MTTRSSNWQRHLKTHRTPVMTILVLAPVELASASSLYMWYRNFEHPVQAFLVAGAFCVLNVTLLLLSSQPLPRSTHRWLLAGAAILLSVTALANVGNAFLHADEALPAERLLHVMGFGAGPTGFTVGASWVFGIAIPAVGLVVWSALAQHLRLEEERTADSRAALAEAVRILQAREATSGPEAK